MFLSESLSDFVRPHARIGKLKDMEHNTWAIDPRTDLYSVGVILYELITGNIPMRGIIDILQKNVSSNLAHVVAKCLEIDPSKRYQSAKELANDMEGLKDRQVDMAEV